MLIGLSSLQPKVGKSEIVLYLKKKYGFINTEMSDAICIIAEKFFGFNGDKSDPAQRKILQDIGYMGKQINPTMWFYHALGLARRKKWGLPTKNLIAPSFLFYYNLQPIMDELEEKGINQFMESADVVIGGIRSPGEADEILKVGGKVFLVARDTGAHHEMHEVEKQLSRYSKFTGVIENNGTIEELQIKIDELIKV